VVHTVAYFCADCAGKGKVQNKPLQLCNEENAANEGERHGTIKVSLLIEYYTCECAFQMGSVYHFSAKIKLIHSLCVQK